MKKIVATLFILIILGGVIFFFGWVQFRVPPGSYGVMRSKTHGVDPSVIREAEFRWEWYAAIPTNAEIAVFTLGAIERPVQIKGDLPSGSIYSAFAGLPMDFSYEFSGSLSFTIKADSLPALMTERGVASQEDLEVFGGRLADEIASFAVWRLGLYVEEGEAGTSSLPLRKEGSSPRGTFSLPLRKEGSSPPGTDLLNSSASGSLETDILEEYPEIENLFCGIHTARIPDIALYRSARHLYEGYLAGQQKMLETEITASANRHLSAQFRFDELARYGELLTKYPILLQYLAMESGIN
jgi:hypothetical protein